MDILNKKYIILEIIPSKIKDGDIIQLSALKIDGLKLIDRFDYRLSLNKIDNPYLLKIIDYDKDSFKYMDLSSDIIKCFKEWIGDYDIYIMDDDYTKNYLGDINNNILSICDLLGIKYSLNFINDVIDKYKLENSNYIVDLLYEAIIFESK